MIVKSRGLVKISRASLGFAVTQPRPGIFAMFLTIGYVPHSTAAIAGRARHRSLRSGAVVKRRGVIAIVSEPSHSLLIYGARINGCGKLILVARQRLWCTGDFDAT